MAITKQSRSKMKHRLEPAHSSPNRVQVAQILQWKTPAGVPSSVAVRKSAVPIDPRESQVFTVEGDLWRIVAEGNDCDFHLELSAPGAGPSADRVIVEVPQEFGSTRASILQKLAANNLKFPAPIMKKSIRLTVTGLAFFDAFHFEPIHDFSAQAPAAWRRDSQWIPAPSWEKKLRSAFPAMVHGGFSAPLGPSQSLAFDEFLHAFAASFQSQSLRLPQRPFRC